MKRFNVTSKTRLLSFLLLLAVLSGVAGIAADPAFAAGKKKITANVVFRIIIVGDVLSPFDNPRAIGRISFSGETKNGASVNGEGAVFIVIDVIGAGVNVPDLSVEPLVAADVRVITRKNKEVSGQVVGKLGSIEVTDLWTDLGINWAEGTGVMVLAFSPGQDSSRSD